MNETYNRAVIDARKQSEKDRNHSRDLSLKNGILKKENYKLAVKVETLQDCSTLWNKY